ncbi:hypothetical protein SAMN04487783_2084 [Agrococcus baldri]|uniref:DUF4386 family protein n=1 Tax=Agrococcus baldri TaxID=153730 RepID=A0AA94HNH9_9MICO|nr:hypothetical protein [Agrococcus baldri]SFS15612.1 hypothetical protein SAMN04487783_2084 [Agrococcus baldri]
MTTTHPIYRTLAALALLLTIVLTGASILLMPAFDGGTEQQLEAIATAGATAAVSATMFTVAQLPMGIGLLAVAHLVGRRSPVLAAIGGTLAVLGCFGHAVHGGLSNVMLAMAAGDAQLLVEHAAVVDAAYAASHGPFMIAGLLGTVLGVVVLAIGLLRSRVAAVWVPCALLAWVLVEFLGSGLVEWAQYASLVLFSAALVGLAIAVWRSDPLEWVSAARRPEVAPAQEQAVAPS